MNENRTIRLSFTPGEDETVTVTFLEQNRCRLEETPLSGADVTAYLGDVIDVEPENHDVWRFAAVVQRAPLTHCSWVVPKFFVESAEFESYIAAVDAAGGKWELLMGGVLFIHVPRASPFDAEAMLDHCIAAAKPRWYQFWNHLWRRLPNTCGDQDRYSTWRMTREAALGPSEKPEDRENSAKDGN